MKVIYEFNITDNVDDRTELRMYQINGDMYTAMLDISEYVREIRKGWKNPTVDEMVDYIQELITDSKVHEIN